MAVARFFCALALFAGSAATGHARMRQPAAARHGTLSRLRGGRDADAPTLVRVRTRDGTFRVSLPPGCETIAGVQAAIEAQLGVPLSAQRSLVRGTTTGSATAAPLPPDALLSASSVEQGALLVLEHDALEQPAATAATPVSAAGGGRRPRARNLDSLVAEQRASQIVLDTPADGLCRAVCVDAESCAAFLRSCRADGLSTHPRVAHLYGRYIPTAIKGAHRTVEVAAVHEVPVPQGGGGLDSAAECARAHAVATRLGLRRVGWMIARLPISGCTLTASELLAAARMQAAEAATAAAKGGDAAFDGAGAFVTLLATPRRAKAKGRAAGAAAAAGGEDELSVEAYQPSPYCVELAGRGDLRAAAAAAEPGLLEPARPGLAFVSGARVAWPNRTAPVEFFLTRVFDVAQAAGWLGSAFPHTPLHCAPGTRLDDASALSDNACAELREHLDERKGEPFDEVLLDWNLLLCAAALLDAKRHETLCDAALEADAVELLRAGNALDGALRDRLGAADDDD
jgi:hypothetical protein